MTKGIESKLKDNSEPRLKSSGQDIMQKQIKHLINNKAKSSHARLSRREVHKRGMINNMQTCKINRASHNQNKPATKMILPTNHRNEILA